MRAAEKQPAHSGGNRHGGHEGRPEVTHQGRAKAWSHRAADAQELEDERERASSSAARPKSGPRGGEPASPTRVDDCCERAALACSSARTSDSRAVARICSASGDAIHPSTCTTRGARAGAASNHPVGENLSIGIDGKPPSTIDTPRRFLIAHTRSRIHTESKSTGVWLAANSAPAARAFAQSRPLYAISSDAAWHASTHTDPRTARAVTKPLASTRSRPAAHVPEITLGLSAVPLSADAISRGYYYRLPTLWGVQRLKRRFTTKAAATGQARPQLSTLESCRRGNITRVTRAHHHVCPRYSKQVSALSLTHTGSTYIHNARSQPTLVRSVHEARTQLTAQNRSCHTESLSFRFPVSS